MLKVTVGDKKVGLLQVIRNQKYLLIMTLPFIVWVFIFRYIPLWGWQMGFQNYKPGRATQQWVGFTHFIRLFKEPVFLNALLNTLVMSLLGLVSGTIAAIFMALLLNEVKVMMFKRTVQTISYLPHFVSWVIVAALWTRLLSLSGSVNELLMKLGIVDRGIDFLGKKELFWWISTIIGLWKDTGWNTILYLAAIAGVNPETYEAAAMDGAGRWRQMWHVTIPAIVPTIAVTTIMAMGWLIQIGFEKQYLLGNQLVIDRAMVIDWYVLQYGFKDALYSFATAVGIFKSVISVILLFIANRWAKKVNVTNLF